MGERDSVTDLFKPAMDGGYIPCLRTEYI